eukprot:m.17837 g.17837  ORF g.17837 m.17837 type:complete len:309 (+) comp5558_c0_seq1:48-974(+)
MGLREVHRQPLHQRHFASVCSLAFITQLVFLAALVVLPFLAAYRSEGFWLYEASFREQASVQFKHQVVFVAQSSSGNVYLWTTFPQVNSILQQNLRFPTVKSREEDADRDGRNDALHFELALPLQATETINKVQLALTFDYQLHEFVDMQMESALFIEHESAVAGSSLSIDGVLALRQRRPLSHSGTRTIYNTPVFDTDTQAVQSLDLATIYSQYLDRNETTHLENDFAVWSGPRVGTQPFVMNVRVRYQEQALWYRPGFWEEVKWGWVQYIAFMLPLLFVVNRFRRFIFTNQLLTTVVKCDGRQHQD